MGPARDHYRRGNLSALGAKSAAHFRAAGKGADDNRVMVEPQCVERCKDFAAVVLDTQHPVALGLVGLDTRYVDNAKWCNFHPCHGGAGLLAGVHRDSTCRRAGIGDPEGATSFSSRGTPEYKSKAYSERKQRRGHEECSRADFPAGSGRCSHSHKVRLSSKRRKIG